MCVCVCVCVARTRGCGRQHEARRRSSSEKAPVSPMADDDIEEIKGAVVQTLEAQGVLPKIRAQLRASVFTAVKKGAAEPAPPCGGTSDAAGLLRDLMQEYLAFYSLEYSRDVFVCEAGCESLASSGAHREQLRARVGLAERRDRQPTMPVLAELLQAFQSGGPGTSAAAAGAGGPPSQPMQAASSSLLGELPGLPGVAGQHAQQQGGSHVPEEHIEDLASPGNESARSYPRMDEYSSYGEESFEMSAASEAQSDGHALASTTGVSIVASDHSADGSGCLESYGVDYMEDFAPS